jgi:hypothetical protein
MVFSLQKLGHDDLHDHSSQFVEVICTLSMLYSLDRKNSSNGGGLSEALGGFQPSLVDADAQATSAAGAPRRACTIASTVRSVLLASPVQVVLSALMTMKY